MDRFNTAVILAGGKSSRMGFDKQLLTVQEKPLYQRVQDSLRGVFHDFAIVTNTPNLYRDSAIRAFSDEFADRGPLAGIHVALKHAKSEYVYMVACDMPVVCTDYIRYMMAKLENTSAQICVTRRNGRLEPFNAFYSVELLSKAEQQLQKNDTSLFRFISSANTIIIPEEDAFAFDAELEMFTNLNTKNDYAHFVEKKKKRT